jgi:hypothetical protein
MAGSSAVQRRYFPIARNHDDSWWRILHIEKRFVSPPFYRFFEDSASNVWTPARSHGTRLCWCD